MRPISTCSKHNVVVMICEFAFAVEKPFWQKLFRVGEDLRVVGDAVKVGEDCSSYWNAVLFVRGPDSLPCVVWQSKGCYASKPKKLHDGKVLVKCYLSKRA